MKSSRREFVIAGATLGITGVTAATLRFIGADAAEAEDVDVSPAEDLMREHGVLRRILLIYREVGRRIVDGQRPPGQTLAGAAAIVRSFIEDYHGRLEEDHLFPRFKKAERLVKLVDILLEQHRAGRKLTDAIVQLSSSERLANAADRKPLVVALQTFVRMYEVHAAREDTVLFPAIHEIMDPYEYDRLGRVFEKKEHERFGEKGFEEIVDRVASIEKSLDIFNLAQFTPRE